MKKIVFCMILMLLFTGILAPVQAGAEVASVPGQVILYTYYRQLGWGDQVQIGCVDAKGGLWLLTGHDGTLKWPYETAEQLEYIQSGTDMERIGTLDSDALFDLKSLVLSTDDQGHDSVSVAMDAGTERSYAVQYDNEEQAHCILLGMSGDDCFENTDPDAQALYLYLRTMFPQVTCYGGDMGPRGFEPVSIRTFCNLEGLDPDHLEITACYVDCETGPLPITLTEEDRLALLDLIRNGVVIGKSNATMVTGGTTSYDLSDPDGNYLTSLEFYDGLLVRSDGMYAISSGDSGMADN